MLRRTKGAGGVLLAGLIALSLVPAAGAVEVPDLEVLRKTTSNFTPSAPDPALGASVESTALGIKIKDTQLTLAQAAGSAGYRQELTEHFATHIEDRFFYKKTPCKHGDALALNGTQVCLDAKALRAAGMSIEDFPEDQGAGPSFLLQQLVDAGVATLATVPSASISELTGQAAQSDIAAVLIPNVSAAQAACAPGNTPNEVVDFPLSPALAPVIEGHLAFASCDVNTLGYPNLVQETGEAVLDVTLNETVIDNVAAVNQALDALQSTIQPLPEAVRTPVDTALEDLQTRLNAQPIVKVRVAPTAGEIAGSASGLEGTSIARGATIDILPLEDLPVGQLDGVAQITVGEANAAASVLDGKPAASNGASVIHIKLLNILSADPDDVLVDLAIPQSLELVEVPGVIEKTEDGGFVILPGTPLQSTIHVAAAPEPVQSCKTLSKTLERCEASAQARSLRISLFDPEVNGAANPLPNVTVDLAGVKAAVAGQFNRVIGENAAPVELPATGAPVGTTALGGLALAATAVIVRRRIV